MVDENYYLTMNTRRAINAENKYQTSHLEEEVICTHSSGDIPVDGLDDCRRDPIGILTMKAVDLPMYLLSQNGLRLCDGSVFVDNLVIGM
jgi:hypothetical protein